MSLSHRLKHIVGFGSHTRKKKDFIQYIVDL